MNRCLSQSAGPAWMYAALENATEGIMIETAERVMYANSCYAGLLGYRRAVEIVSRPVADLVARSDAERVLRFGRLRVVGKPVPSAYDFAALRRDGSTVRLQASVSVFLVDATAYIMTIAHPLPPVSLDEPIPGPHDQLSTRERQVMQMILAGTRPKDIALELEVTENTVATHRARLLDKIGAPDNRALYKYALRYRLVDWS